MSGIKFTGMASGLDTDSIVKAMLGNEQNKIDNQLKKKTLLEWQKEAEKEISDKVYNFYTKYANNLRLQSTFNAMEVSSSNNTAIQLTGNGAGAVEGSHKIEVKQLASGFTVPSKVLKYTDESGKMKVANKDTKVSDLGLKAGDSFKLKSGDVEVEIKISADDQTLTALTTDIQKQLKDTSLNFRFDATNGAFIISSKSTGAEQTLEMTSDSGALEKLGLSPNADGKYSFAGQNAIVDYNGGLTIESASNAININGLSFTALSVTESPIDISVSKSTDEIVSFVKEFVNEYNKLIDELNIATSTKTTSYKPLTDAEKESMTESQIEKWEEQAKQGILYNNQTVKNLTSSMRDIMNSVVEGNEFGVLANIGITTGAWSERGRLTLNEAKLEQAIKESPESVMELFTSAETGKQQGIGQKLYSSLQKSFSSSKLKSNGHLFNDKALNTTIVGANTRLSDLQSKYTRMENIYYAKFTAMEKTLSMLNSQSSALSSYFTPQ